MHVESQTWWSKDIGRDKSVTVALPRGYAATGRPVAVLYLLHGFGGNRHSWLTCPTLADSIDFHRLLLVLPESGRYWLINDAGGRRYEDYLVNDVVHQIDQKYNTVATPAGRAIAGFSMGGATSFFQALRHPDVFSVAGSFSGAFEAPLRERDPYTAHRSDPRIMMPTVREHERVWGPVGSAVRQTYDPYRLLASRDTAAPLRCYVDVGLHDYKRMIAMNRRMHAALVETGVSHAYSERAGGHDWRFVDAGLPGFFSFLQANLPAGAGRGTTA